VDNQKDRVLQGCLESIRTSGWLALNLCDIANELGLSYQEIHQIFPEKSDVLSAFFYKIIQKTFDLACDLSHEENSRDRLFTVTMAHFEAALPYKPIIHIIWKECFQDPQVIIQGFSSASNTITWLLNAAGLETSGWANLVRVHLFGAAYLDTLRTWLKDETPDMAQTMGALDRHLGRLSHLPGFF